MRCFWLPRLHKDHVRSHCEALTKRDSGCLACSHPTEPWGRRILQVSSFWKPSPSMSSIMTPNALQPSPANDSRQIPGLCDNICVLYVQRYRANKKPCHMETPVVFSQTKLWVKSLGVFLETAIWFCASCLLLDGSVSTG